MAEDVPAGQTNHPVVEGVVEGQPEEDAAAATATVTTTALSFTGKLELFNSYSLPNDGTWKKYRKYFENGLKYKSKYDEDKGRAVNEALLLVTQAAAGNVTGRHPHVRQSGHAGQEHDPAEVH